ncbi:MAG TPA: hypothetical protein VGH56_01340 [Solirubrobacteraceae bacterium]|jgi:hypothetical protein|nr:hypothetical protein [Steroidobacteraceae bacterium]
MIGRDLFPEDREALQQIVSRSGLSWRQFRFLHGLLGSMHTAEARDYVVMMRRSLPSATVIQFPRRRAG